MLFWEDIQQIIATNQDLINKYYHDMSHISQKSRVFIANHQYSNSFKETLFLHKRYDESNVNLVNLFVMHKYKEYDSDNKAKNDLPQRLARFVQEYCPFLFIEGNAGCGKSSLVGWMNYYASRHDDITKCFLGDRPLVTIRLRDLET